MPFVSSKGDGTVWHVTTPTIYNEAICDCPGYNFRGTCKHIGIALADRCTRTAPLNQRGHLHHTYCECGEKMVIFDPEPEFD